MPSSIDDIPQFHAERGWSTPDSRWTTIRKEPSANRREKLAGRVAWRVRYTFVDRASKNNRQHVGFGPKHGLDCLFFIYKYPFPEQSMASSTTTYGLDKSAKM